MKFTAEQENEKWVVKQDGITLPMVGDGKSYEEMAIRRAATYQQIHDEAYKKGYDKGLEHGIDDTHKYYREL